MAEKGDGLTIDQVRQRDEHDRDLASRVVDLILAEDVFVSRLHADNRARMIERIMGALDLARMDEKSRRAPPVNTAIEALLADDAANSDCSHVWIRIGFSKTTVCKKCGATIPSPDDPIIAKDG